MSNFLAHFIGRPILVLMAALTIGVIGFVSATKLQVAMMPSGMASANVSLFITANDMTPNEVEEQVYEPLEGELMTIPGVKNVWGSCYAGGCRVGIEMSPALDPRLAAAEVRDRLQRARTQWPAHVDRWFSWRETSDSIPLMFFAFALPDHSQRWFEMIDKEVKPKLEALDGVGQVSVWGMVDESVRILFDRDKLRALRLNISTILNRLRNDNLSVPVGELEDADTSYIVRADLRYHDLETIRGLPIGRGLRLREVAEVRPARSLRDSISRVNGKSTAMGLITQAAGSNTVDTAKNVRALLDEISERPELDGLKTIYMFDQGEFIEHSLKTLVRSALTGGALAFLVLLLFLRRLKMTLVITLSLPLSLLVALSVIYMTGDSLNILSMAGLTIALGMLVDNSIVVLENIYRIKQHGVSWYQACVRGVQEVGTAVFLATITTIAVFLPVIFAGDNPSMQTALLSFGLPLCMALAASLFVALVLLPSMTAFVHRNQEAVAVPTSTSHKLGSRFAALQTRLLEFGLRYRFATLLILVGLAVGGTLLTNATIKSGVGGDDSRRGQITIQFDFERGTTLKKANDRSERWEHWLDERRKKWNIKSVSARFDRLDGRLNIAFPTGTPHEHVRNIVTEIKRDLPQQPGVEFKVHSKVRSNDDGRAKESDRGFMVQLQGHDAEHLRQWANALGEALTKAKLASEVDLGNAGQQKEVRVHIARDRMQELGVDPGVLFGTMRSGLRGQQVSRIRHVDGRDMRLIAEYDDAATMELKDLKELQIWSQKTGFRRLGDLADFKFENGHERIFRRNGVLTVWVGGSRSEDVDHDRFAAGVATIMRSMPIPRGYRWTFGGSWRSQNEDASALLTAVMLGATLVLIVMGVLFESIVLPIAVFCTLPFAIVGGRSGLAILGVMEDNSMWFGLLILAGVIVNNGIVLLDHIVRLQKEGRQRGAAIFRGVQDRMRAILMTASTTIVGLTPMIFVDAGAQRGISYVAIASVVAAGLFFGTMLTPLVVPLAYTLLDDARIWLSRLVHGAQPTPTEVSEVTA